MVCDKSGVHGADWERLGRIAIAPCCQCRLEQRTEPPGFLLSFAKGRRPVELIWM